MKLNKRGIAHGIDWIIGIVLFLMTIAFILVLFKPGVTPLYESQTLLDVVQNNVMNDTSWEISTTPIFLYPSDGNQINSVYVKLTDDKIDFASCATSCTIITDPSLSQQLRPDVVNMQIYYIRREETDSQPHSGSQDAEEADQAALATTCESSNRICNRVRQATTEAIDATRGVYRNSYNGIREGEIKYLLQGNELTIPADLSTVTNRNKLKYLIVSSSNPINFGNIPLQVPANTGARTGTSVIDACTSQGNINNADLALVTQRCQAIYEIGARETFRGIDLAKFSSLNQLNINNCGTGYECLKQKWGFPTSKEFKINIEVLGLNPGQTLPQNINTEFPMNGINPPSNVNVYVRNFNTFILTDDGTQIPIKMNIKIW